MYSIMLVDDEKWILESLKGTVDWQAHGFRIVGEAYNGLDAFDRIAELQPDAAFIDIRMPGMNGIDLIKRLRSEGMPVECIVASGYAEFEYAKQALQYGAAGYCLKPFNQAEIEDILARVRMKLAQSEQLLQLDLLDVVYGQEEDRLPDAAARRIGEQLQLAGGGLFVVVVQDGERLFSERRAFPVRIGRGKTAYLLSGAERDDVISALRAAPPALAAGIGISRTERNIGRLRELIEAANIASYRYFTAGIKIAEAAEGAEPQAGDDPIPEAVQLLDEGVTRQDQALMRQSFELAAACFRSDRCDIRHALRLYNLISSFVYRAGGRGDYEERYAYDYDELVASYGTVEAMLDDLQRLMTDSIRLPAEEPGEGHGDDVLPRIVQYVGDHFREHLSIQDIARRFFMHPNYVSALFKKEMRVNFTKYVTDLRMEHACKLLRTTELPVGDVAEQAGYSDYFYFAKAFKRQTGKTPSEYRAEGQ